MKNLTQLREQIDAVDKQIVELFEQRMQISADVAKYKISIGKKLKSEGVLYLEEGRNGVKRKGCSYYKINIKALQDVTGIDICDIL